MDIVLSFTLIISLLSYTFTDDVDTELVRKLASKAISDSGSPEKGKKVTPKQNGVTSSVTDIRYCSLWHTLQTVPHKM